MFDPNYQEPRFISPLTSFGIRRLFRSEENKELLIALLNALLPVGSEIVGLTYLTDEQVGDSAANRRYVFDVCCSLSDGDRIIVEMQNAVQVLFRDRNAYYSSFPICKQAEPGSGLEFRPSSVYAVGLIDFKGGDDKGYYHCETQLVDKAGQNVFYDKLTHVFVDITKFEKDISQCDTPIDKWVFVLNNLSCLSQRPAELQGPVFEKLFRTADMKEMQTSEIWAYEESLKIYRDWRNTLYTAYYNGLKEGLAEVREKRRANQENTRGR